MRNSDNMRVYMFAMIFGQSGHCWERNTDPGGQTEHGIVGVPLLHTGIHSQLGNTTFYNLVHFYDLYKLKLQF